MVYKAFLLFIIGSTALGFFIRLFVQYNNNLKDKETRLMQFYLDKKFINKVILSSLNSNKKFQTKFCLELIEYIKEYFQLYDIIIMQPTNLEKIRDKNSFRDQVKTLINNKYDGMELKPRKDNIIIETIKIIQNNFHLYLYPSCYEDNNKNFIICATKEPHNLNKDDIASVEIVINLLRLHIKDA